MSAIVVGVLEGRRETTLVQEGMGVGTLYEKWNSIINNFVTVCPTVIKWKKLLIIK